VKDLFYSPNEQLLFWVAGYTADGSTDNVLQMIKSLKKYAGLFAKEIGVKIDQVETYYVLKSRRYKYMRIFYAKVEPEKVGADVFTFLNSDWTMLKWLTD
jgi:hypothetical protein